MMLKGVLLVEILGSILQLAPFTHASADSTTMTVTCDSNIVSIYVDGNDIGALVSNAGIWNVSATVTLNSYPALVAIHCDRRNEVGGMLAHFSDGQVTDAWWKCSSGYKTNWYEPTFNDSHWPNAHEIAQYPGGVWGNVAGMTGSPYWIWTTRWDIQLPSGSDFENVYCRRTINDCTQTVAGHCSKTCGVVGVRSITSVCGAEHYYVEEYCCDGPCKHSGSGSGPGTGSGGGSGPGTPPLPLPPTNLSVSATCAGVMELYVNGVLHAESEDWSLASTVHLGVLPAVVAIKCVNDNTTGGILAHFSNGEVTDDTWKCSNTFEDRWNQISFVANSWTDATEVVQFPGGDWGVNVSGMTGEPYWIWTSGYSYTTHTVDYDPTVYCRKTIGADARHLCRNYPPLRDA